MDTENKEGKRERGGGSTVYMNLDGIFMKLNNKQRENKEIKTQILAQLLFAY